MATYAEFLKSQGASDEDLKILDHPVARKAWEKQQADAAAYADAQVKQYHQQVNQWYATEIEPSRIATATKLNTLQADLAAERGRIKALQDAGLLEVAQTQDARATQVNQPASAAAGAAPESFDPKKYNLITGDALPEFAKAQGRGMITLTKIMKEHEKLGLPDADWESLYDESTKAQKPFGEYWETKYEVAGKRAAKADADNKAYEDRIRKDAIQKYQVEQGIQPGTAAPRPSGFAFTKKSADGQSAERPWLRSEAARADSTVERAMQKAAERMTQH